MIRAIRHPDARAGAAIGALAAAIALAPSLEWKLALCAGLAAIPLLFWTLAGASRWMHLFFAAALLLPPLPVALGNSGPHVAVLFAGVGLWIGLLHANRWEIRMDGVAAAVLALCFILLASVGIAALQSGVTIAAGSLARVLLFGIGIYVFFSVRDGPASPDRGETMLRVLFFAAAGSALFACIDFYFQFPAPAGFGPQFLWLSTGVFRRAQGVFYEASTLGNLCSFFLVMIAAATARRRAVRLASAPILMGAAAAFAGALILSYSRASLVNLAIALAALLWLHRGQIRAARWLWGSLAAAAGVAALIAIVPSFADAYWIRLANSVQYFAESPNAVLSGRLDHWKQLTDFLITHPWDALIGVGFKTLPYTDIAGGAAIADNTYLSMLVETGVAGLASVIFLNIAILRSAYRAARCDDALRSFCGTWMFCFWCGQTVQMASADLLTYWRVLPVYFCVLALADRK